VVERSLRMRNVGSSSLPFSMNSFWCAAEKLLALTIYLLGQFGSLQVLFFLQLLHLSSKSNFIQAKHLSTTVLLKLSCRAVLLNFLGQRLYNLARSRYHFWTSHIFEATRNIPLFADSTCHCSLVLFARSERIWDF
jgi:hypothetical protein